jgi:hypothetical protein
MKRRCSHSTFRKLYLLLTEFAISEDNGSFFELTEHAIEMGI